MPRRARIRIDNIPWHVVHRAHNRQRCFHATDDFAFYLNQLAALAKAFDCAVHAYVLMSNHVHLLMTPANGPAISSLMKRLGQRFAQRANRIHGRTGSLWEGRFRSSLVESERYLFCCYRYVELNPVRAGLVEHPREYPWSSYRVNAEGAWSQLIKPHDQYLQLAENAADRATAYRELFSDEENNVFEMIRARTHGGFAIGSDEFRHRISNQTGQRTQPLRRQRGPLVARAKGSVP